MALKIHSGKGMKGLTVHIVIANKVLNTIKYQIAYFITMMVLETVIEI